MADLWSADIKVPDSPVKTVFLWAVETAVRLYSKLWFGVSA